MKKKRLGHKSPKGTCQDQINGVDDEKEDMKLEITTLLKPGMNDDFNYDDQIDD